MTHFLRWQEEAFALHSSDRYALLSGLAYNHLHRDLFTALASGATFSFQAGLLEGSAPARRLDTRN